MCVCFYFNDRICCGMRKFNEPLDKFKEPLEFGQINGRTGIDTEKKRKKIQKKRERE